MKIREGSKEDLNVVFSLIKELADFVNASDQVDNTLEKMLDDGFGDKPAFHFFVAESDGKIVGLALYYYGYSTWKGKFLYLEDLVVTEPYRGQGIGKALFSQIIAQAKAEGLNLVGWQVLSWNKPAIDFYEKIGAAMHNDWINCRLNKDQIEQHIS